MLCPVGPYSGDSNVFKEALIRATKKLDDLKEKDALSDFVLIGSIALARWTAPRATSDIDFALKIAGNSLKDLGEKLGGEARVGDLLDPLLGSITFMEQDNSGEIPIQLVHFPPALEKIAFEDPDSIKLDGVQIPVIDWKALVLLKLYAGSTNDLNDARSVIQGTKPSKADIGYIKAKAAALRLSRRWERIAQ